MNKSKYSLLLIVIASSISLYAAPPENYVLTTQKVPDTISEPQASHHGFIIKDSNSKVKKFREQKKQNDSAENKYLDNEQKGVYPVLQGQKDQYQYGLNPSSNNH